MKIHITRMYILKVVQLTINMEIKNLNIIEISQLHKTVIQYSETPQIRN